MPQSFPDPQFTGSDRFVIERQLGSGGFGVVYSAYDRKQNGRVALKLLRHADGGSLYRFKQEFRALAGLTHPNLIRMYELLNDGADWFFTMELVNGVDFLTYVRGPLQTDPFLPNAMAAAGGDQATVTLIPDPNAARSRVDLARLRAAAAQLVRGLCALHQAGKLHRDLKPSNVLIDSSGRVVILDFGLVSELSSDVAPTAAGTPGFMAPEQAALGTVAEASDWYSVGVMLYQALTGRLPRRDSASPPAPGDSASGIPEDLDKLVHDLLQVDPSARPSGAEMLARLQMERPVAVAAQSPFVGRAKELKILRGAYGAARSQPVVVLVHGGSGIGKSALVTHFLTRLRQDHPEAIVLTGRCYQRESVPHKAIDSLIDALARYLKRLRPLEAEGLMPRDIAALAQLFPVLRQVESVACARRRPVEAPDVQEQRRRAFSALKELLARIADGSPLVMCIDDLHWGDLDSLSPLVDVVSPPDPPGLLLLSCYRSEEAGSSLLLKSLLPAWRNLGPSLDVREMALPELGPEEARELVRALSGERRSGAQFAEQVVQESGGNPFWITELAERQDADGKAPARLDQVVMERVSQLPEAARRLLDVIAVSGAPVETKAAFRAAGLESEDPQLLPLLCSSHFVWERSTAELEPYHDRIRQAVVASLNPGMAMDCHLRLALALEAHPNTRDPETLAIHFRAGGDLERAAGYAAEAASQAAQALAFDRAVRLYRLALERPDFTQSSVPQLQMRLGDSLSHIGRGDEAAQAYLAGAEKATDPVTRLELRRRAAEQLLLSGQVDAGLSVLRAVLKSVGLKLPKTTFGALLWAVLETARLEIRGIGYRARDAGRLPVEDLIAIDACGTVSMGLATIDPIRALAFSARHLLLALKAGEASRVCRALSIQAGLEGYMGSVRRSRVDLLLREARKLADQTRNPHDCALTTMITLVVHFNRGEWKKVKESEPEWEEWSARAKGAQSGLPGPALWEWCTARLTHYGALHFLGDFGELSRQIPLAIRDAQERCDQYTLTNARCRFLPIVYLAADRSGDARRELDQAIGDWSLQSFYLQHYFHEYAAAEVDLYAGEPRLAWDRMRRLWKSMRQSHVTRLQVFAIEARHVRARAAIALASQGQDEGEMISDAEREARLIARQRTLWGDPLALLIRAGVASLRGRMDEAARLLETAESSLEAAGMMHYLAAARRRRGEILGGAAGATLIDAAEIYYAQQGVKNPVRMTDALAPGRWG